MTYIYVIRRLKVNLFVHEDVSYNVTEVANSSVLLVSRRYTNGTEDITSCNLLPF